jgi:hypothetical protein
MTTQIYKGLLKTLLVSFLLMATAMGYTQQKVKAKNDKMKAKEEKGMGRDNMNMNMKAKAPLDTMALDRILGMKGKVNNGEYKVTIPQNDLSVMVDEFKITPPMGLSSWVAFTPSPDGAMVMGDIIITETDLKPVQQEIIKQGLTSTAIHNHFLRNHPNVMYMHMGGSGSVEVMAQKAKAV